jgi:hypothetical protein
VVPARCSPRSVAIWSRSWRLSSRRAWLSARSGASRWWSEASLAVRRRVSGRLRWATGAEPLDLGAEGGVAVEQRAGHLGGVRDGGDGDRGAVVVETAQRGVCPCAGGLGSVRVAAVEGGAVVSWHRAGLLLDGLERVDDLCPRLWRPAGGCRRAGVAGLLGGGEQHEGVVALTAVQREELRGGLEVGAGQARVGVGAVLLGWPSAVAVGQRRGDAGEVVLDPFGVGGGRVGVEVQPLPGCRRGGAGSRRTRPARWCRGSWRSGRSSAARRGRASSARCAGARPG